MKYLLMIFNLKRTNQVIINYLLPIAFCFLPIITKSQVSEWKNYTNSSQIICQASKGSYVWVGTNSGIIRVNIITKETIFFNKSNSGLPSNFIKTITIDSYGNKWIGTYSNESELTGQGLVKFDDTNWTVYNTSNSGLPDNNVTSIKIDSYKNKWIGTKTGIAKYNDTTWTTFNTKNSGLQSNTINTIAINDLDNKYIGTDKGLSCFDGIKWSIYNTDSIGFPDNNVNSIAFDSLGNTWILAGINLVKFNGNTFISYNSSNSDLPDSEILNSLIIDTHGNKWIATEGAGIFKFNDILFENLNTLNSLLTDDYVRSIAVDSLGNKWIGTLSGLFKYDDANWTYINTSLSGLPNNNVTLLDNDEQGNNWIITYDDNFGGLFSNFDGTNWTQYTKLGITTEHINAIAIDSKSNKWLGCSSGLAKFDGIKWNTYNPTLIGLPSTDIKSLAIDSNDNVWIATSAGLALFDGTKCKVYNTANSGLPANWINSIAIDSHGNKWLASDGLVLFDGTKWTVFNATNSGLPKNTITSIAIDSLGKKWIGTYLSGVATFSEDNVWKVYDTSNSDLPGNQIASITIDLRGSVWIGTDRGLAKYDGINWKIFKTNNSKILDDNVQFVSVDNKNNKWIATSSGLSVYSETGADVENLSISSLGNNSFCKGGSVTLQANTSNALTYQWKKDDKEIADATNSTYIADSTGHYSIFVKYNDNSTKESTKITVNANPFPSAKTVTINPAGNLNICTGNSITLMANIENGLTVNWFKDSKSVNSDVSSPNSLTTKEKGIYNIIATNKFNCSTSSSSVTVSLLEIPVAKITASGSLALNPGDSLVLSAISDSTYTYQWTHNNINISSQTNSKFTIHNSQLLDAGSYSVIVTSNICSNTSNSISVTIYKISTVTIVSDAPTVFCDGNSTKLKITGSIANDSKFQWRKNNVDIIGANDSV